MNKTRQYFLLCAETVISIEISTGFSYETHSIKPFINMSKTRIKTIADLRSRDSLAISYSLTYFPLLSDFFSGLSLAYFNMFD